MVLLSTDYYFLQKRSACMYKNPTVMIIKRELFLTESGAVSVREERKSGKMYNGIHV